LIFFRLCLDGIAGIYFGIKMGFPHLWAVVKAHFSFYGMALGTIRKRGSYQTKRYYQNKWIVFKNFL